MANLAITVADVLAGSSSQKYPAGATITQGQTVYRSSNTWLLADATTALKADCKGIAVNSALIGQPLGVSEAGNIDVGATLTVGLGYFLSATAGAICPEADLVTGDFPTFLGFATTASNLSLNIRPSGVEKP